MVARRAGDRAGDYLPARQLNGAVGLLRQRPVFRAGNHPARFLYFYFFRNHYLQESLMEQTNVKSTQPYDKTAGNGGGQRSSGFDVDQTTIARAKTSAHDAVDRIADSA